MDAKSKADFINSVAAGEMVSCPICGKPNKIDNKFCIVCGAELKVSKNAAPDVPAFESVKEASPEKKKAKYVEPNNVFAQGLPEWSIEPPQIMVRRR